MLKLWSSEDSDRDRNSVLEFSVCHHVVLMTDNSNNNNQIVILIILVMLQFKMVCISIFDFDEIWHVSQGVKKALYLKR